MPAAKSTIHVELFRPRNVAQIVFKSAGKEPLDKLSELQRTLLCCELAFCHHLVEGQFEQGASKLGFHTIQSFRHENFRAFIVRKASDTLVVVGGPVLTGWQEFQEMLDQPGIPAESVGKVHPVFKAVADHLWPEIEGALETNELPLWFTGYSLGAAVAHVMANRCLTSYIKSEPSGLYTFGSPRIGCRKYVNYATINHQRWVYHHDGVPSRPPLRLGYQHGGQLMHIDVYHRINAHTPWQAATERLQQTCRSLLHVPDSINDHAIVRYVDAIFEAVLHEEHSTNRRTH